MNKVVFLGVFWSLVGVHLGFIWDSFGVHLGFIWVSIKGSMLVLMSLVCGFNEE
jgi:hypothetical protein